MLQLLLVVSCVNEHYISPTGSEGEYTEVFFTKAVEVDPVRVIVLGSARETSDRFYNNDQHVTSLSGGHFRIQTLSGFKDMYFFANEPSGYTALQGDVSNYNQIFRDDIFNAAIPFDPAMSFADENKIPMSSFTSDIFLSAVENNVTHPVELIRRMSKVTVRFNYKAESDDLSQVRIEFLKVGIVDLPAHYFWIDQLYHPDLGLLDTPLADAGIEFTAGDGLEQRGSNTFYLPSYKVSGDNKAKIKLVVERFYKSTGVSAGVKNYYVALGDALNSASTGSTSYDLSPNTHYDVTLDIKGNLSIVYTDIRDWEREDVHGDINPGTHINAPALVVMDYKMLGNTDQTVVDFEGTDETFVYVNGVKVEHGHQLISYLPESPDMSWITNSEVEYDGYGGSIHLKYDPLFKNIDYSNYKLQVELHCRSVIKKMSVISTEYAGLVSGNLDDWDSQDTPGDIVQQRFISALPFVEVNTAAMADTIDYIRFPFSASSAVYLTIADQIINSGQSLDLSTSYIGRGWINEIKLNTDNIEIRVKKGVTITDQTQQRVSFSLSTTDNYLKKYLYALYLTGDEDINTDNGDWDSEAPQGDIDDSYYMYFPLSTTINYRNIEHTGYYDIIYGSTHPVSFTLGEHSFSEADADAFIPGAAGNGWIGRIELQTNSGGQKIMRLFVNNNVVVDDLTRNVHLRLRSNKMTKEVIISYAGRIDDVNIDNGDWDSENSDVTIDRESFISVEGNLRVSQLAFSDESGVYTYEAIIPFRSSDALELSYEGNPLLASTDLSSVLGKDWIESAEFIINDLRTEGLLKFQFSNSVPLTDRTCLIRFKSRNLTTHLHINYDINQ